MHHTMRSVRTWIIAVAAVIVLVVGGFIGVYVTLFSGSSAPPLSLAGTKLTSSIDTASVAGVWKVGSGSVAGYRVREQLASLPAKSDAVGRTHAITGSMTVKRSSSLVTVTTAGFTVDVSTLTSDQPQRDDHIRSMGIQSDTYPKATFKLTQPVTLPASATNGTVFDTSVTGKLTMHGTTRTVTIPISARLKKGVIETVGSITFPFSEFKMQPPSIGGFVSVENNATMEFDLRFRHS